MKTIPNKITLSKTVVINTWFCRDDFETQEEWEQFLKKCNGDNEEAEQAFLDGIEDIDAAYFCDTDIDVDITYQDENDNDIELSE